MGELTEAQHRLLSLAASYGSMYCGYDQEVKDAARALEGAGLGVIVGGTFGPELAVTVQGHVALAKATGGSSCPPPPSVRTSLSFLLRSCFSRPWLSSPSSDGSCRHDLPDTE
jgi:hypothetical protein